MPIYVSLLRGINVGGNKRIKMADLRDLYKGLDLKGTKTVLQSGNAVFKSDITDAHQLGIKIEAGIKQNYGFDSLIMIRSADAFKAIRDQNPFLNDPETDDPAKLLVMFLSGVPESGAMTQLQNAYNGPESMHLSGSELFLYYPEGMGRSKLTTALIERMLGVSGTGRNWKTCNRLFDLIDEFEK